MTDAYAKMSESKDLQDKLAEATRNAKDAEEAYAEAQKKRNEAISEGIDRNSDEMYYTLPRRVTQIFGVSLYFINLNVCLYASSSAVTPIGIVSIGAQ